MDVLSSGDEETTDQRRHAVRFLLIGLASFVAVGTAASAALAQQSPETSLDYQTGGQSNADRPDYHVVSKGDTLWDLSGRYFGDPLAWPRLWSYNSHITNPHWIYPGDIVYLKPEPKRKKDGPKPGARAERGVEGAAGRRGGRQQGARGGGATGSRGDRREPPQIRIGKQLEPGLRLSLGGFITKDQPYFVGRVIASPKPARMISGYDTVWVGLGSEAYPDAEKKRIPRRKRFPIKEPETLEQGSRFGIVRAVDKVRDSNGNVIGTKYWVIGSLVVTQARTPEDKLETALIDQSWAPVERGDFLVPYERQLNVIQHVPAEKNVVAKIIDQLEGGFSFGEFEYVFVNKGAAAGIRVGNRAFIYQRRTGVGPRWQRSGIPDVVPWQRVGRLRFVNVREHFSTAIITDSKREVEIGDRLEMYAGN
ncbi:MAG: LysM peptidoglycan-binding domain-containing protein [Bradymonadaceae bacterium]